MRLLCSSRLFVPALLALSLPAVSGTTCLAEEGTRFGVGGGIAAGRYHADRGEVDNTSGIFAVLLFQLENGAMGHAAFSFGDFSGNGPAGAIDIGTLRMDLSAGYVFRRKKDVRPFVHGGLSMLSLSEPSWGGGALVEDSTVGFTVGFGLMAMQGPHGFYLDAAYDPRVTVETWSAGEFEFDYTELHVGYVWVKGLGS